MIIYIFFLNTKLRDIPVPFAPNQNQNTTEYFL